jgi:hypothetical protein
MSSKLAEMVIHSPTPPTQAEAHVVRLPADLTIQTIAIAHAGLVEALREHRDVVLVLDAIVSPDVTLVQLVDAARRSAIRAGGSFSLSAPADGALLEVLRRGGFLDTAVNRVFWLRASDGRD